MERKDRLKAAFDFLRSHGKVHTQIDIANAVGASRSNVSSAFNGDEKCLTDRFLHRFNNAFDGIFNLDWLINGNGDMLSKPITSIVENSLNDEERKFYQAQIQNLMNQVKDLTERNVRLEDILPGFLKKDIQLVVKTTHKNVG